MGAGVASYRGLCYRAACSWEWDRLEKAVSGGASSGRAPRSFAAIKRDLLAPLEGKIAECEKKLARLGKQGKVSLRKSLLALEAWEKARGKKAAIGEKIRRTDGYEYIKLPNGKWRRVYTRGKGEAASSAELRRLKIIRNKLRKCEGGAEMLKLVLEHKWLFSGEHGEPAEGVDALWRQFRHEVGERVRTGRKGEVASVEEIDSLVSSALSDRNSKGHLRLGAITARTKQRIKRATGLDVSRIEDGCIDKDCVRHIYQEKHQVGEEDVRGVLDVLNSVPSSAIKLSSREHGDCPVLEVKNGKQTLLIEVHTRQGRLQVFNTWNAPIRLRRKITAMPNAVGKPTPLANVRNDTPEPPSVSAFPAKESSSHSAERMEAKAKAQAEADAQAFDSSPRGAAFRANVAAGEWDEARLAVGKAKDAESRAAAMEEFNRTWEAAQKAQEDAVRSAERVHEKVQMQLTRWCDARIEKVGGIDSDDGTIYNELRNISVGLSSPRQTLETAQRLGMPAAGIEKLKGVVSQFIEAINTSFKAVEDAKAARRALWEKRNKALKTFEQKAKDEKMQAEVDGGAEHPAVAKARRQLVNEAHGDVSREARALELCKRDLARAEYRLRAKGLTAGEEAEYREDAEIAKNQIARYSDNIKVFQAYAEYCEGKLGRGDVRKVADESPDNTVFGEVFKYMQQVDHILEDALPKKFRPKKSTKKSLASSSMIRKAVRSAWRDFMRKSAGEEDSFRFSEGCLCKY